MSCPRCGAPQQPGTRTCTECGAPLLAPISNRRYRLIDADGREFLLPDGVTRIGRDLASNEIVLLDPSVSARHAAIEVSPRAIVVRDLGSRNGTSVNGTRLSQAAVVQEGDRLGFGGRELVINRQPPVTPALRAIPLPASPVPQEPVAVWGTEHLATALATIALTLLALMLNLVAVVDGFQRDELSLPLPLALVLLVGLPLLAIGLLAAGRRSGYLVAAIASVTGLAFIMVAGPILAGASVRNELRAEYGSTGYWFIALASLLSLVVEILVLTVALAGWRALRPSTPATVEGHAP